MFIVIEGNDGTGKTEVVKYLNNQIMGSVATAEPYTPKIKSLLTSPKPTELEKILLFVLDRSYHFRSFIKPALQRGKVVICDRFTPSSYVYNDTKITNKTLEEINNLTTDWVVPNFTFILYADRDVIIDRIRLRQEKNGILNTKRAQSELNPATIDEVTRRYFNYYSKNSNGNIHLISTNGKTTEEVGQSILKFIKYENFIELEKLDAVTQIKTSVVDKHQSINDFLPIIPQSI
jgi:dTMP kinase